jgi:hypothetical protein
MRPAVVRYNKRFIPMMLAYAVALLAVTWIFKHHLTSGPVAYLLALLPALPIVGVVIIVGLYMGDETDEVEKAMRTQSMLWGIGLTLSIATLWGFLESFGQVSHVDSYWAFPIFCFFTGIASCLIRQGYR